jgi:tetratricopeptide (TPR) repeat protein
MRENEDRALEYIRTIKTLMGQDRFDEAMSFGEEFLQEYKTHVDLHLIVARAYILAHNIRSEPQHLIRAKEIVENIHSVFPDNVLVNRLRDELLNPGAKERANRFMPLAKTIGPNDLVTRSENPGVIKQYMQIALDKAEYQATLNLGIKHYRQLKKDPVFLYAFARGFAAKNRVEHLSEWQNPIELAHEALELAPLDSRVITFLVDIYAYTGQYDKAIGLGEEKLHLLPVAERIYLGTALSEAYIKKSNCSQDKDYERPKTILGKVLSINPHDVRALRLTRELEAAIEADGSIRTWADRKRGGSQDFPGHK